MSQYQCVDFGHANSLLIVNSNLPAFASLVALIFVGLARSI